MSHNPHTSRTRDAALRRLHRANRWLIAGSAALTGVLTAVAASAFPGKTLKQIHATAASREAHRSTSGTATGGSSTLKAPSQAPRSSEGGASSEGSNGSESQSGAGGESGGSGSAGEAGGSVTGGSSAGTGEAGTSSGSGAAGSGATGESASGATGAESSTTPESTPAAPAQAEAPVTSGGS